MVVKMSTSFDDLVWSFDAVSRSNRSNADTRPHVVMFAFNSLGRHVPSQWVGLKRSIQKIFNVGGTIVVSSGNNAEEPGRQDVDTFPALWSHFSFPLTVAGSVDNHGHLAPFYQGPDHVTAWAPGVDVRCATRFITYRISSGTSYSVRMVSSLYYFAVGSAVLLI